MSKKQKEKEKEKKKKMQLKHSSGYRQAEVEEDVVEEVEVEEEI